jgi:hypothetical protein
MAEGVPARLTQREGRRFGLQVGPAFLLLGGLLRWRGHELSSGVCWVLGAALILAGLVVPDRLGPVYRSWMGLAFAVSRVTNPIIMGAIYFGVITPLGFLLRLFGHRPMVRAGSSTAWVRRDAGQGRSDLTRQF